MSPLPRRHSTRTPLSCGWRVVRFLLEPSTGDLENICGVKHTFSIAGPGKGPCRSLLAPLISPRLPLRRPSTLVQADERICSGGIKTASKFEPGPEITIAVR